MKYSTRTRRSLVAMFKLALANLPDGLRGGYATYSCSSPYICDTIRRNTSDYEAADVATDFIAERIGYMFSIEAWLKSQSEEVAEAVRYDVVFNDGKKLQAYRKDWLRSLIKEFKD